MQLRNIPLSFLIHRSVRYLLVSHGFRVLQAVVVLAVLSFVLTGNRIADIDRHGNRADIVAAIVVTIATIALLRALNRRVMNAIDRRFFREAYNAQLILTELGEAIPTLTKTRQLVELVADKLSDALHPENVTIFLDNEDSRQYDAAFSFDAPTAADFPMATRVRRYVLQYDDGLISQLRESKHLGTVELTEPDLASPGPGAESASILSDHEKATLRAIRSSLLIPIVSNGRLLGLISLGRRLSDLHYRDDDKRLMLVVAQQIASFIENMKMINQLAKEERLARELEMAAEVQRHLFPADGLENDALDIYGICLPALGVGGDYYDYFDLDASRTGIAIADVAGKGIAAALLMSTVQASLHCQLTSSERPLSDVVSSMNRLLRRSTSDGGYATFFFAEFDKVSHGLTYVNAGHNPPMLVYGNFESVGAGREFGTSRRVKKHLVEAGGGLAVSTAKEPEVRLLTTGGPIIGSFLNEPYEQETIQVRRGDMLVVYTDGVTEAQNPAGAEFGEERLRSIMLESLELPAHETAIKVLGKVLEWQGQAPQHDDITLIVVKVK